MSGRTAEVAHASLATAEGVDGGGTVNLGARVVVGSRGDQVVLVGAETGGGRGEGAITVADGAREAVVARRVGQLPLERVCYAGPTTRHGES